VCRRILLALFATLFLAGHAHGIGQPAEAMVLAFHDASKSISAEEAKDSFYIWLSGPTARSRKRDFISASGGINSLSLSRRVVPPVVIMKDGEPRAFNTIGEAEWSDAVLLRLNIRHYGQSRRQFDLLGDPDREPYFHIWLYRPDERKYVRAFAPWLVEPLNSKPEDKARYLEALVGLVRLTGNCSCPIVEGRNFVWQTAIDFDRGTEVKDGIVVNVDNSVGYYGWLGIKDQKTFEKLVRLDRSLNPYREVVSSSEISVEARAIERYGRGDGTWFTYDQVNQRGIGNRNPIAQILRDKFLFDGVEIIGPLDNGMRATYAGNNKGQAFQSAPDGIGYHHQTFSNDGKIHVGYMVCWACHDKVAGNGGLHPFKPYFRELYADLGPAAFASEYKGKVKEELDEQYLTPLDPFADNDKRQYAAALEQCTGVAPHEFAAAVVGTFKSFDLDLDLEDAASEYGVAEDELILALKVQLRSTGIIDNVNANWIKPKVRMSKMTRTAFTEFYNQGQLALRGIKTWPKDLKDKLRPYAEVKK
jgi:hypothetical protein